MGKRTKYKTRPDGRRVTSRSYDGTNPAGFCGKKYFYGASDEEIDAKIEAFERSLWEAPPTQAEALSTMRISGGKEKRKSCLHLP